MNVYIYNGVPDLVLQKVLDFHNNTWGDFTYVNIQASGLVINTSGGYCTQSEAQTTTGSGCVGKAINAKRFWGRIKFQNTNHAHGAAGVGVYYNRPEFPNGGQIGHYYPDGSSTGIEIQTNNVLRASMTASCSLDTYYYLDLKFDHGLYTCTLLDSNLNKLKEITYQSTDEVQYYSGFLMWGGWSNRACWRIYEYREAYDNN